MALQAYDINLALQQINTPIPVIYMLQFSPSTGFLVKYSEFLCFDLNIYLVAHKSERSHFWLEIPHHKTRIHGSRG